MVTDGTGTNVSIAANTPMLLKGQKGNTYTFKYTDTSNTTVNTALRGSVQDEHTTTGNPALTNWYTMTAAPKQAFIGLKITVRPLTAKLANAILYCPEKP